MCETKMMTNKLDRKQREELQLKIDYYSDMLFKLCFLRLQNRQDAEDVVQEVLYQYIRRDASFESEEHEKAWLIKVAMNGCRKLWRSAWYRHRNQQVSREAESRVGQDNAVTERAEVSPESDILRKETNRMLLEAVMKLPLKYRDVIHLFYYEDLSVKQIAEITGRKESTVTSQLTRGREMLKKMLKEDFDFA